MFDLQQSVGGVNVSSGCAPAPGTQTLGPASRGLRAAAARKVGPPGGLPAKPGVGGWWLPHTLHPYLLPPGFPPQPPAHPGPCLHTTPDPQDHPRCLPVWWGPVQSPGVHRPPGTPRELVRPGQVGRAGRAAPWLTALLGPQVTPVSAHPPSHPARTPAARSAPGGGQPLAGSPSEPRTLRRSDRRPWAPAPRPEPPAFTGWPVAHGEGLGEDTGRAPGTSTPTRLSPAGRCLCAGRNRGSGW